MVVVNDAAVKTMNKVISSMYYISGHIVWNTEVGKELGTLFQE